MSVSVAKSKRNGRIAELIQTTVAQLLQKEVNDPRLKTATITAVDLSPDNKNAIVFFSLLDPTNTNVQYTTKAFQKATGFFRLQLSHLTEFRHTPKLIFKYDASLLAGERISNLLNKSK